MVADMLTHEFIQRIAIGNLTLSLTIRVHIHTNTGHLQFYLDKYQDLSQLGDYIYVNKKPVSMEFERC